MFSKQELKDLAVSTLVVSVIFSSFSIELLYLTIPIVILVFISHELGHKFTAQRYGFFAEYRRWDTGLFLGLIMSLLGGFAFIAPGAVYISPFNRDKFAFRIVRSTKEQYGKISLAGPLTNIIIGISALVLNLFYPISILPLIAKISLFLSVFNLIPFPPLDGFKVFGWDRKVWGIAFAISLVGLFL